MTVAHVQHNERYKQMSEEKLLGTLCHPEEAA